MSALAKNYNRRKIAFKRGKGSFLYSSKWKKIFRFCSRNSCKFSWVMQTAYLTKAMNKQSKKVWHVSNAFIIPEGEKLLKD